MAQLRGEFRACNWIAVKLPVAYSCFRCNAEFRVAPPLPYGFASRRILTNPKVNYGHWSRYYAGVQVA